MCALCSQQFKVPLTALARAADAQKNMQEQFDRHKCANTSNNEQVSDSE
jgi:hypothetical protein